MERSHLYVRADADACMGTGHLMRCLALAQAWRESGRDVTFRTTCTIPGLLARLTEAGAAIEPIEAEPGSIEDARLTREAARRVGAGWVVLDGYHFGGEFQSCVRGEGVRVLAIDDYGHADHYWADVVLNQNLHARADLYSSREPYTQLLLGPRFALLRREFWKWRGWRREIPEVARKVLVTLGGSDPDNVTLKVVEALKRVCIRNLEAVVVTGAANPHRVSLTGAMQGTSVKIELRTDVPDMAELMAWADAAVAAGGTTTWERALLGLPTLVMVLADNQRELAEASESAGIGRDIGTAANLPVQDLTQALEQLLPDSRTRAAMAWKGPQLVDGQGAHRICLYLHDAAITLRPVQPSDCRRFWEWANEPTTRGVSFSTNPIPWEEHQRWFTAKLNDPKCAFFVALDCTTDQPIGQVRLDREGDTAIISIALEKPFRGHGYGPRIIRRGASEAFQHWRIDRIHAFIRTENEASYRAFLKAGFRLDESLVLRGYPAYRLALQREQL